MMRDTEASLTLISTTIWQQVSELKVEEMVSRIETYHHHKLQYLCVFIFKVLFENKLIVAKIAVVKVDRKVSLLGRVILNEVKESIDRCFSTRETDKLPAVRGVCASIKLKQDAKPMFCAARKLLLPLERKTDQTVDKLLFLGILVPVEADGIEICPAGVWVEKGENFRLCAE